eukprot:3966625-Alexandrium_andersonii.AAC.1
MPTTCQEINPRELLEWQGVKRNGWRAPATCCFDAFSTLNCSSLPCPRTRPRAQGRAHCAPRQFQLPTSAQVSWGNRSRDCALCMRCLHQANLEPQETSA